VSGERVASLHAASPLYWSSLGVDNRLVPARSDQTLLSEKVIDVSLKDIRSAPKLVVKVVSLMVRLDLGTLRFNNLVLSEKCLFHGNSIVKHLPNG
jgi:hypothetical protein